MEHDGHGRVVVEAQRRGRALAVAQHHEQRATLQHHLDAREQVRRPARFPATESVSERGTRGAVASHPARSPPASDVQRARGVDAETARPGGARPKRARLRLQHAHAQQVLAGPARPVPRQVAARHGRHVRRDGAGVVLRNAPISPQLHPARVSAHGGRYLRTWWPCTSARTAGGTRCCCAAGNAE